MGKLAYLVWAAVICDWRHFSDCLSHAWHCIQIRRLGLVLQPFWSLEFRVWGGNWGLSLGLLVLAFGTWDLGF